MSDLKQSADYVREMEAKVHRLEASEKELIWQLRDAQAAELAATVEVERLNKLINNPHTEHFLSAVQLEAAHQQERWASSHDAGKEDADWFWLVGYLAGKAIRPGQTQEKRLHHIITTAAACLNWHGRASGTHTGHSMAVRQPSMRPGLSAETQAQIDGEVTA